VKGRKKIYQANGPPKTGRGNNTYLGQSRLQAYNDQMRQMTLHTNKRGNTPKGNNSYQPITPILNAPQFYQTYSKGHKNHINSNIVVLGDFYTPLSPIDRSSKQKIVKKS
jgi:hypothetical protein